MNAPASRIARTLILAALASAGMLASNNVRLSGNARIG